MPKLYTDGSVTECFAAGKAAADYGMNKTYGPTNVHTIDAGLECLQHINVLTQGHDDEDLAFAVAGNKSTEECCQLLRDKIVAAEAGCPAQAGGPANLDPATIMLLLQAAAVLKKLFGW